MAIKPFRMKDDYGELGYNEENKSKFLRDAAKLMRTIGRILMAEPYNLPYTSVTVNKAGIAVSGEVALYIVLPDMENGLMVQVSECSFPPDRRGDALKVLLQYRQLRQPVVIKKKTKLPSSQIIGSNQWFQDAYIDTDVLTSWIEGHIMDYPSVKKAKQECQQREDDILAKGDLKADSIDPETLPTVSEVVENGGELGQLLSKIKTTMDEMNATINACPLPLPDAAPSESDNATEDDEPLVVAEIKKVDSPPEGTPVYKIGVQTDDDPVKAIIRSVTVTENSLVIEQQLDRDQYQQVAKVITKWGGKWSRQDKAFIFRESPQRFIDAYLDDGKIVNDKKAYQFYETPEMLAHVLVKKADIQPGQTVLEPSAGKGRIAQSIRLAGVEPDTCELWGLNKEALQHENFNIVADDFLQFTGSYDRIVMNPPYAKGAEIEHVMHAFDCLNGGGIIVAVVSQAWQHRTDKKYATFRSFIEQQQYSWDELAPDTFRESGASVQTGILTMHKKAESKALPKMPEPVLDVVPPANDDEAQSLLALFSL